MTPMDLIARAIAIADQGGQHLELRLRYIPPGRIVQGGSLGQPPQQQPATFTVGIYEVGADEHMLLAKGGQTPDQSLGQLGIMIIDRGMQWFIPGDKPRLEIVPDDGEDEESTPTLDGEGGDDEPSEDALGPDEHGDDPPPPAEIAEDGGDAQCKAEAPEAD